MSDLRPNIISLFLVVGALAGNASVAGLDLFACAAVPAGLLLFLQRRPATPQARAQARGWWLLLAGIAAVLLTSRAIEIAIPYFDLYWLWPAKALVLALFLLQQRGQTWPLANDLLLGVFSLAMLLASSVEEGRLYSLFGPNMLYRFFGASFLFSLIRAGFVFGARRNLSFALVAINTLGLALTGSVGALGVMLGALYLARDALARLFRSIWGLLASAAAIAALFAARDYLVATLFSRLAWKYQRLDEDVRFTSWQRMIESEPGLAGHDYRDLAWLWTDQMPYPHNAALELWVFYGVPGAALFVLLALAFFRCRQTRFYFFIPLVVIGIGAMVSGDLSDNFALFSLPILYLARPAMLTGRLALPPPAPVAAPVRPIAALPAPRAMQP